MMEMEQKPMSQPKLRKRVYTLLALLAVLYTIAGIFLSSTAFVDYFGLGSEYKYDIGTDPKLLVLFVLVTGILSFLLFVFLARRAK